MRRGLIAFRFFPFAVVFFDDEQTRRANSEYFLLFSPSSFIAQISRRWDFREVHSLTSFPPPARVPFDLQLPSPRGAIPFDT